MIVGLGNYVSRDRDVRCDPKLELPESDQATQGRGKQQRVKESGSLIS